MRLQGQRQAFLLLADLLSARLYERPLTGLGLRQEAGCTRHSRRTDSLLPKQALGPVVVCLHELHVLGSAASTRFCQLKRSTSQQEASERSLVLKQYRCGVCGKQYIKQ